jgi:hypothetical protein
LDGASRIDPDPREGSEVTLVRRDASAEPIHDGSSSAEERYCSAVIAQALPGPHDVGLSG